MSKSPNCGCSLLQMACKWLKKLGATNHLPSLKLTFSPLKMDDWKTILSFLGRFQAYFSVAFAMFRGLFWDFTGIFGGFFFSQKKSVTGCCRKPKKTQALCDVCRNFTDLVQQNATEIRGCVGGGLKITNGGVAYRRPPPTDPPNDLEIPNHKLLVLGLGYVFFHGVCWKILRG